MSKRGAAGIVFIIIEIMAMAACVYVSRLYDGEYITAAVDNIPIESIEESEPEPTEEPEQERAPESTYEAGRYDIALAEYKILYYNTLGRRIIIDRGLLADDDITIHETNAGMTYGFEVSFKEDLFGTVHINDMHINDITISGRELLLDCKRFFGFDVSSDEHCVYIDLLFPKEKYPAAILIDPGHGGEDCGAVVKGIYEKDLNLTLALELARLINDGESGYRAYLTRDRDTALQLSERVDMGEYIMDFMISIHHNTFDKYASVHGTEVYYKEDPYDHVLSGLELAGAIQESLVNALGSKDRGIVPDNEYKILRYSIMPAVLVEVGYMTNEAELARLTDGEYQRRAAEAMYNGILEACSGKNFRK